MNPTPWRISDQGGIVDANGAPVQRSRQIIVAAVNSHEGMRDALFKACLSG